MLEFVNSYFGSFNLASVLFRCGCAETKICVKCVTKISKTQRFSRIFFVK